MNRTYGGSVKRNQISGKDDPEWYNKLRSKVQAEDVHREFENLHTDKSGRQSKTMKEQLESKIFD